MNYKIRLYIIAWLTITGMLSSAQTLVWSEEFNYTSAPDSDVWSYDLGNWGWGNQELQNYTSDAANVRVDGTNLVITATKQGNGGGATFASARIKTLDKLTFKYGTIEARISTPDLADGLWPAFWTLGNDFPSAGWPECGEIDIMEMGIYSAINDEVVNQRTGSHFHWYNGGYVNYGGTVDLASPIDDTFVIYRMEWTPSSITMYINGSQITTMNTAGISEFNAPHFFLLNMAVGGTYTDIFNANGISANFPAEYRVDWIRLYDEGHTVLGGSSTVTPPTPGTNLLENSGFEGGTDGWDLGLSGGIAWGSSTYDHSGGYSVKIDSNGAGDWASPNLSQSFSASEGDVFNMQGYMLNPVASPISGGSFGLFKIEFLNSSGGVLDPASVDVGAAAAGPYYGAESAPKLNAGSATDSWIFSEVQAAAPAGTEMVRFVLLNVNAPGNPGPMYFDEVEAILLGDSNNPPVFDSATLVEANATEDAAYTGQTLAGEATDSDGDTLTYSKTPGGPAWLSVATNGVLSGMPGNGDVGLNSWTVEVSDGKGGTDTATLQITVDNTNDAPVFTVDPINEPNALEGSAYSETIAGSATDVDAGASLSYSLLPGGPAWLSMTTNGILSGVPGNSHVGANSWSVQVSDGNGGTDTAALQITVDRLNIPPEFTVDPIRSTPVPPPALSSAVAGADFHISFPSQSGVSYQVVTRSNLTQAAWVEAGASVSGNGNSNSVSFSITDAARFYKVLAAGRLDATEDSAYSDTLAGLATDADGDTLTYTMISGPPWLIVATNGVLSGMPGNDDAGTNSWTIAISDGFGGTDTATLEIIVDNVNDAPVFTVDPISKLNATEDAAYAGQTLNGSATDVDAGASLSYSLLPGGPAWLSMTTNGILSGVPGNSHVGANSWTVQVSDGNGGTDTAALQITVDALSMNLLANSGFESGDATGWTESLGSASGAGSTAYANSGTYSLLIDGTAGGAWASPHVVQSFPANPGDEFNFKGYILTTGIADASFGLFKIEYKDSGGNKLIPAAPSIGTLQDHPDYPGQESAPTVNSGSATGTWILSEVQGVAPAGTAMVEFYILNVNANTALQPLYFDDVEAVLVP